MQIGQYLTDLKFMQNGIEVMSTIRNLLEDYIRSLELDEFLEKELDRAGYGGVETTKTPLGTRLIIMYDRF